MFEDKKIVDGVQLVVGGSLPNDIQRGESLTAIELQELSTQIELLRHDCCMPTASVRGGMSPQILSAVILSALVEESKYAKG